MLLPAQQNIQGLTLTDIALADSLLVFDSSASNNQRITVERLLALMAPVCCGRLTTQSSTPISTGDRNSQSTLYFTPYQGNIVKLYDGTRWKLCTFSEVSKALTGLTNDLPYDVFLYDSSGTLTLEFTAWTSKTARVTALTTQDGVLVKTGDATRLFLGTFHTTSTTTTADAAAKRFVWNYYNRVPRTLTAKESTTSWTYTTATFREINAGSTDGTSRVAFVIGWPEDPVEAAHLHVGWNSTATVVITAGIGLDSSTVSSATTQVGIGVTANNYTSTSAKYRGWPGVGYHTLRALEFSQAAGTTTTWIGINSTFALQTGLTAFLWG